MVSVILPSIRSRNLKFCIDKFIKSQEGLDYEIISIYETIKEGPIQAIWRAAEIAKGDYIFLLNDMAGLSTNGLIMMEDFSKLCKDEVIVNQNTIPETKLEYYGKVFAPYPFVHRKIIEKMGGFFDTRYKGFYADPDFSLRAHEAKIPIVKCPGVTVTRESPRRFLGNRLVYAGHKENISKYFEKDKQTFIKQWEHLGIPYKDC